MQNAHVHVVKSYFHHTASNVHFDPTSSYVSLQQAQPSVVQAYQAAITRVIKKKKASAGSAHVLDLGTGSGILAVMAAQAGADSVVACDLHDSLCNIARQVRS